MGLKCVGSKLFKPSSGGSDKSLSASTVEFFGFNQP